MNTTVTGIILAATLAVFMILLTMAENASKKKSQLIDCKVFYILNMVNALYYDPYKKIYYERTYTISLWPIRPFEPIKFDIYFDGSLVLDKRLRKKVLQYIKNNPPC